MNNRGSTKKFGGNPGVLIVLPDYFFDFAGSKTFAGQPKIGRFQAIGFALTILANQPVEATDKRNGPVLKIAKVAYFKGFEVQRRLTRQPHGHNHVLVIGLIHVLEHLE